MSTIAALSTRGTSDSFGTEFKIEDSDAFAGTQRSSSYCTEKWKEALEICQKNLNDEDAEQLEEIKTCEAFFESLARVGQTIPDAKARPLRQLVFDSLQPLRSFVTLLAAALGSTMIKTAMLWGVMSLVIQAASVTQTLLPSTIDMLNDLGHDLEIFQIYEPTFEKHNQLGNELMDIFVDIITFWTQIVHFLRRNKHGTTASGAMPQVYKKFEDTSMRIKKRAQQIKEKVEALAAVKTQSDAHLLEELDRLSLISTKPQTTIQKNQSIFPCNNIPFAPNTQFSGREEELDAIRAHFSEILTTNRFCSFALYGIGGIGKTQTALHFAHEQVSKGIEVVIWLNCETGLSMAQSFYEVADMLSLEGLSEEVNTSQNRYLVLKWLRKTSSRWLMVMDNIEDLSIIRNAWPVTTHGAVLVTSRNSIVSIAPAAAGMEMQVFQDETGSELLTRLIGRLHYSEEELESARQLSQRLGGLPLALAIMAFQIRLRNKSITEFLQLYNKHYKKINKEKRGIELYYNFSLATCWQTAFEFLMPEAIKLLEVFSHIAPDHIPEALFKHENVPDAYSFRDDDWVFSEAVDQLSSTGLLRQDPETKMMYVHRLIQEEFRNYIGIDRRRAAFVATSELLNAKFPKLVNGQSMRPFWDQCKLYTAHVLLLCARYEEDRYEPNTEGEFDAFLELSISAGWYLMECGAWSEELELMRTALYICKDKEGLVYAALANSIGITEIERGHAHSAHDYIDKSLKIRQRLLPADHPEVANSLNAYANIIFQKRDPGDWDKALEYFLKCIEINKKCPAEHRDKFLHIPHLNAARLFRLTNQYEKGLEYVELSRQYSVKLLGKGNHFEGAVEFHYGNHYFDQGMYDNAKYHWKLALAPLANESETHPSTTAVKLKLCCVAIKQGEYDIAIQDLSRLLIVTQLNEKAKGDKGETARVLRMIAEAYELKGDTEQAVKLRDEAEAMRKEIQGARFEKFPDEDLSYAMMSFHGFW